MNGALAELAALEFAHSADENSKRSEDQNAKRTPITGATLVG